MSNRLIDPENRPTTRYFYDGQMPMEEDYNPSGSITKVTRNTLGGRGIDMISTTQSSTTTLAFPLYDGHGNMVATLSRGSSSYSVGNQRTYDVWGSVRSGSATGDPTKRYVANLGTRRMTSHTQTSSPGENSIETTDRSILPFGFSAGSVSVSGFA